jgi:hypothetical protein
VTLVSDIIQRAYRISNIIPLGATPSSAMSTEALNVLNPFVQSVIGNEAGDKFIDVTIGGTYDDSGVIDQWVPDNVRLLLNLTAADTYLLDPRPTDGQRFAIVDLDGNLATYNIVLDGNGRNIEDTATVTLSTNSLNRQWMYRADTGNWVRIATLATSDQLPFPEEFDDYFITMLAMRLNPTYGQSLAPETLKLLSRSRGQLNARYSQMQQVNPDVDWRSIPSQRKRYGSYGSDSFDTGRTY